MTTLRDLSTPIRTGKAWPALGLALAIGLSTNPAIAGAGAPPPFRLPEPPEGNEPSLLYAAVHGGLNRVSDWTATVKLGAGVVLDGRLGIDRGYEFGVLIGRESRHARFELEYQQGRFDIRTVAVGPITETAQASGSYRAATLNVYRTERVNERLDGYVGLGLGFGSVSLPTLRLSSGCECLRSAAGNGPAYQLRAGLEARFDDGHNVFVQASLLSLPGPRGGNDPGVEYRRRSFGALQVGYRRTF